MKKIKLEGKLSLNKETVTRLNDAEMQSINGGFLSWFWCGSNNCATGSCPDRCTPITQNICIPYTEGASVCQSACGNMHCP
jgi:hypothetical protein